MNMMCHKTWRLLAAAALVSGAAAGDYQGDEIEVDLTLPEEGAAVAVTAGHTNATLTEWVLFNVAVGAPPLHLAAIALAGPPNTAA